MNKIKYSLLLAFAIIIMAFAACKKKNNDTDNQPAKPTITISSPQPATIYMYGDTVWVKAAVTHVEEIHEVSVNIKRTANDSTVFEFEKHADDNKFGIDTFWVNNVSDHSDMLMTIQANDHDGNIGSQVVNFHCMPK